MIRKSALLHATVVLAGVLALLSGRPAHAANLIVNTAADEVAGTNCSLREALAAMEMGHDAFGCKNVPGPSGTLDPYGTVTCCPNDFINVPAFTIYLSQTAGTIHVRSSVTIQGAGYLKTIIDGHNLSLNDSPIAVGPGVSNPSVHIRGLTIQNSLATGLTVAPQAQLFFEYGRILNAGNLTQSNGGCIFNAGDLTVIFSELKGCKSSENGGGILNDQNGYLAVDNTTIHECISNLVGGGIASMGGQFGIFRSTLANNVSRRGAGVYYQSGAFGTPELVGVTIAYNEDTQLPGESSPPSALFQSSQADYLSAILIGDIIAKNTAPNVEARWKNAANCGIETGTVPFTSEGYNILGDPGDSVCPGQLTSGPNMDIQADPRFVTAAGMFTFPDGKMLPKPGSGGGVGPVYIPSQGSPALSRVPNGDPSLCSDGSTSDQRNVSTTKDTKSNCDIGAVSRSSALFVVANPSAPSAGDLVVKNTLTNLGFDVTMADGNTVTSTAASDKAIVVISKSAVNTRFAGATFRDVTIGVLSMDPFIYDDMQMTGPVNGTDFASSNGETNVSMAGTNPLLGGLEVLGLLIGDGGTPQVTTSAQTYGWGVPAGTDFQPGATIHGSNTRYAIFGFALGESMSDNFTAPASRVGFFATQAACATFTAAGQRLLEEAIIATTQRGLLL